MAQLCYSGIQGSGKSYEVVRGVVVPNVAKGRRVVTNVAGLQYEKIAAYCVERLGADPEKLGEIVHVSNDDVTRENFFPKEGGDNSGAIVQGGDVVILDECWRWYVTGEKLPDGHLTFFRMHRHFTHPVSGCSCDIVLIVQDIDDLQRKIKATIEKSFLMQKHKALGMPDRYVVTIYAGNKQTARAVIESMQCKYDPEIFALYSSYSQAQSGSAAPKEVEADKRGKVFNNWRVKFAMPAAVLMICGAFYGAWRFFHPESLNPGAAAKKSEEARPVVSGSVAGVPPLPSSSAKSSEVDDVWRLVGFVDFGGRSLFMLSDSSGRVRYFVDPPGVKFGADVAVALPSGAVVTRWSGAVPRESVKVAQ